VALFPKVSPLARFVQDPDEDDPETALYLERLAGHALLAGQLPVFKFCRTPLRAGWLRRVMPKAAFLYLNRNPDDLHRSYWSQGGATNYFSVQYAAVLLLHGQHPRWRISASHLLGPDAEVKAGDVVDALHRAFRLCRDQGAQFGRDLSLLFWVHALLDNLRAGSEIRDYDRLVDEPQSLDDLHAQCQAWLGMTPRLRPPRRTPQPDTGGEIVEPALARCIAADLGAAGVAKLAEAAGRLHGRSANVLDVLFALNGRRA